jgi:NAD(P)-dependent dehydrogenase (short-subunit alcohol dehydrogenase family)
MDFGFKGKTAIITGGTKGIGSGISEVFAEEGANLIVDYRSDVEGSERFIQSLRDRFGANAYGIQADVSVPEDVTRIFDFAQEKFGRLDILVNNAGSSQTKMVWDITLDEWRYYLDNNLNGMFMMSREFAVRLMAENKGGRIVNLLSKASLTTTTKGRACYVTNKTAQMGLTKQLAVDLTDKGIIVNGIMPGSVTSQLGNVGTEQEQQKRRAERLKRLPMGRFGEPYEFGKMVAFLASEQCQLAVGAVIDFTGGMMLGF